MDSGNSGSLSLQSSSGGGGGDDEFDSRYGGGGEESSPLSALLRPPPPPAAPSSSSTALPGFGGSSFYGIHDLATPPPLSHAAHWPSPTTHQLPATGDGASSTAPPQSSGGHGVQPPAAADQPAPARGSRKRARASRRAPTTVLTTDTSNFRAMVQEFTGVPAPPFAAGASARSSRFDHFFPSRSSAALASAPYLLRPFAHKLQPQAPSPYPPHPPFVATASANQAIETSTAPRTTMASGDSSQHLASALTGALDMPGHGNYLSYHSATGAQLEGNASTRYPKTFHSAGFSGGLAVHGAMTSEATRHLRPRPHGGDNELSGLVGAASASTADGCNKRIYTSGAAGSASIAGASTTTTPPAMRAPGAEASWICTSE
ncbi:hypothetical protein QOZ80_8BG0658420 [Eleusine coracana subsp. coracana]|nr:hypothetical protein QOZ80_8BG0658420 [Eleusine coracana subsp. coracana]